MGSKPDGSEGGFNGVGGPQMGPMLRLSRSRDRRHSFATHHMESGVELLVV
jgi:hypothetical protein